MSTTDLAQQVADLTTATTALTQEVVGQKDRLTLAADTATGKASESSVSEANAAASASAALTSQNVATQEADRAEVAADNASQVSGMDTVEEAVDAALDARWDTAITEQGHDVLVASNLEERDYNSGFDQWGKQSSANGRTHVNQGLTCFNVVNDLFPNAFMLGETGSSSVGESKAGFAITAIAGVVSQIRNIEVNWGNAFLKLEPAPDGTQQWKDGAVFDYAREVDPKYGDIASTHSEAVSRNFEGEVRNGDFRLGDNGDWESFDAARGTYSISGNSLTITDTTGLSAASIGMVSPDLVTNAGDTLILEYVCLSNASDLEIRLDHYSTNTLYPAKLGYNRVEHTVVTGSTGSNVLIVYVKSNGTTEISNVSLRKVSDQILTNPTDLVMLEHFDELDNVEYFPHGMIQTGLTDTWNGLPLVASIRPASYFAVFDGQYVDGTSVGTAVEYHTGTTVNLPLCIKIGSLTAEQKKVLVAHAGEGFWINTDGDVIQRRVRQRSIRGGNGKWDNTDSASLPSNNSGILSYTNSSRVEPQGIRDSVVSMTDAVGNFLSTFSAVDTYAEQTGGTFTLREHANNANVAYNGQCFAQVLGSIPRLNSGAYHVSLNEFGCGTSNSSDTASNGREWHHAAALPFTTQADTFNVIVSPTTDNTNAGVVNGSGSIGNGSGHPAGLFFDGIMSQGLNGFVDQRLSVQDDLDLATSKRKADDKNGETRGRELLEYTSFVTTVTQNIAVDSNRVPVVKSGVSLPPIGTEGALSVNGVWNAGKVTSHLDGNNYYFTASSGTYTGGIGDPVVEMFTYKTNIEVSGEYSAKMVIGSPENILSTDVLKDGWYGTWCPVIPAGTTQEFPVSYKNVGSPTITALYSSDSGITWVSTSTTIDSVTNSITSNSPVSNLVIYYYTAHTKHTQPSANMIRTSVDSEVVVTQSHKVEDGVLLTETLTGSIATSDTGKLHGSYAVIDSVSEASKLLELSHQPIDDLDVSNVGGVGVVAEFGTTEINGLTYPTWSGKQIISDGVDFGDDGLIINNGVGTKPDLNGATVVTFTHVGLDSIGFSKQ